MRLDLFYEFCQGAGYPIPHGADRQLFEEILEQAEGRRRGGLRCLLVGGAPRLRRGHAHARAGAVPDRRRDAHEAAARRPLRRAHAPALQPPRARRGARLRARQPERRAPRDGVRAIDAARVGDLPHRWRRDAAGPRRDPALDAADLDAGQLPVRRRVLPDCSDHDGAPDAAEAAPADVDRRRQRRVAADGREPRGRRAQPDPASPLLGAREHAQDLPRGAEGAEPGRTGPGQQPGRRVHLRLLRAHPRRGDQRRRPRRRRPGT